MSECVCVCVRAYVRACVRACVRRKKKKNIAYRIVLVGSLM